METFIIIVNESEEKYIIQSIWSDNEVNIKLLIDSIGYTGTVPYSAFQSSANELEISSNEFIAANKYALTTDGGAKDFCYKFDIGTNIFNWRKIIEDSGVKMKIVYGSVKLKEFPNLSNELILQSIQKARTDRKCLENIQKDFNEFKMIHEKFRKAFELLEIQKNNTESDFLTIFVKLLNSKKQKIRELEKTIKKLSTDNEGSQQSICYSSEETAEDSQRSEQLFKQDNNIIEAPALAKRMKNIISHESIETTSIDDNIQQPCSSKTLKIGNNESNDPSTASNPFEWDTQKLFDKI